MTSEHEPRHTQGGGYPPGGYGGGPPPGGYGPPGSPPGGNPPGGYGPPGVPGGYGPPGYGPGAAYGAPNPAFGGSAFGPSNGPSPALKKLAQTWLIVSIASCFFCTSCLGIVGAVFCYLAMQAVDQGNLADAETKLKWGKILTIVGLVIGVLLTLGSIAFWVLNYGMAMFTH